MQCREKVEQFGVDGFDFPRPVVSEEVIDPFQRVIEVRAFFPIYQAPEMFAGMSIVKRKATVFVVGKTCKSRPGQKYAAGGCQAEF
jgi:hypothetical protein